MIVAITFSSMFNEGIIIQHNAYSLSVFHINALSSMIIQLIMFIVCLHVCSMEGVLDDEHLRGLMPSSFHYIFDCVKAAPSSTQFLVRASFVEVYKDDVYDLLNTTTRAKLELKESPDKGVYVKDLSEFRVNSVEDCIKCLRVGQKQRKVGATKMNEGSSRSHSILSITIETSTIIEGAKEPSYRSGKLNLVDLAGSERQKKTEASGDRLDEAKSINWSLTVLGNCIKALIDPHAKHVPYRDSKLTRLLQDSLGGNTKTLMIANIGPSHLNAEETMATLRYADRAKQIKNKPVINADPKDTMLKEMQDEITQLKAMLEAKRAGQPLPGASVKAVKAKGPEEMMRSIASLPKDMIEEQTVERIVEKHTGITDETVAELQAKSEAEMQSLLAKKASEKAVLDASLTTIHAATKAGTDELDHRERMLASEEAEMERLTAVLLAHETALLQGQDQVELARQQQFELQRLAEELNEKRQHQEALAHELEQADEAETLLATHYASKEEELQKKAVAMKKLWTRYNERKNDLTMMQEEFENERMELMERISNLDQQFKLKNLLVESFIPPKYVQLIEKHSRFDPSIDEWTIKHIGQAGNFTAHSALEDPIEHQVEAKRFGTNTAAHPSTQPNFLHYNQSAKLKRQR